jgi:hypothetical protein
VGWFAFSKDSDILAVAGILLEFWSDACIASFSCEADFLEAYVDI